MSRMGPRATPVGSKWWPWNASASGPITGHVFIGIVQNDMQNADASCKERHQAGAS